MRVRPALLCIVTPAATVRANVEKTIFRGPAPVALPHVPPSLQHPHLHALSHAHAILPTQLPVRFPSAAAPRGLESWYLLHPLHAGQRYEVRICWPATQPTDFWLDTFTIHHVLDTPELISSLAQYSQERQASDDTRPANYTPEGASHVQSLLLLRIQAAASYYSTNRTLMLHPESVHVDIILDPFLLNILPQSLGPFAIYFTVVATGAWFLSGYIYRWLASTAAEPVEKAHIG
ncbi:hypothetical protein ACEQ8H_000548 [Pleosporales sp. CAS-2024a]